MIGASNQGDATEHSDRPDQPNQPSASARPQERAQAVRFAPNVEEIGISSASPEQASVGFMKRNSSMQASDITPDQIRALADSLRNTDLQEQRMKSFSFHPVSLPASRVCISGFFPLLFSFLFSFCFSSPKLISLILHWPIIYPCLA